MKNPITNLASFLSGLFGVIFIKAFGTFSLAEPLLIAVVAFRLLSGLKIPSVFSKLALFSGLWLLGVFISDLFNQSDEQQTIKMLGVVILFYLNTLGLYILLNENTQGRILFLIGLAISYLLQFYYFPPPLMAEDFASNFNGAEHVYLTWVAITHFLSAIALAAVAWSLGYQRLSALLLLAASFATLYLGSRAFFLIGVIATAGLFYAHSASKRGTAIESIFRMKKSTMIKGSAGIVLLMMIATLLYGYLAQEGVLGDFAQHKYQSQKEVETFGLASGRIDFFESLYAISKNPFLGYGSYANDGGEASREFYSILGISSLEPRDYLPNHSHLLGTWTYSGLLALPMWIYLIALSIKASFHSRTYNEFGILLPYSLLALWNILFSPLGYRIELCFLFAIALMATKKKGLRNTV